MRATIGQYIAHIKGNILPLWPPTISYVESDAKLILQHNIRARTAESPNEIARRCFWPSGKKKGQKIAPRTIRYVFEQGEESPSPTLDVIVALARALDCEPWELLISDEKTRENVIKRILGARPVPDAKVETHGFVKIPSKHRDGVDSDERRHLERHHDLERGAPAKTKKPTARGEDQATKKG